MRQFLTAKGFSEGGDSVLAGGEQVEKCGDGALRLGAVAGVDGDHQVNEQNGRSSGIFYLKM